MPLSFAPLPNFTIVLCTNQKLEFCHTAIVIFSDILQFECVKWVGKIKRFLNGLQAEIILFIHSSFSLVIFLEATKARNSSKTQFHSEHTLIQQTHSSLSNVTTVSRSTGMLDVHRTLHLPLPSLINSE